MRAAPQCCFGTGIGVAVAFFLKDRPTGDASVVLLGIAIVAFLASRINGPWKREDGQVSGLVGLEIVTALIVWVFVVLRDVSNPCIEYRRTDDGGQCIRYANER